MDAFVEALASIEGNWWLTKTKRKICRLYQNLEVWVNLINLELTLNINQIRMIYTNYSIRIHF